jgi:hypothetical protein
MAKGSRCCSTNGSNLTMLSAFGLVQMSDLLRGVDPRLPNQDSIGSKVAPLIRQDMRQYINDNGWDIEVINEIGSFVITAPQRITGEYIQYVYNLSVDGWGLWRGLAMNCAQTWHNVTYFGTKDGKIYAMDSLKDNVLLNPTQEINGEDIEFSMLTSYQHLGSPAEYKIGMMIRPDFLADVAPSVNVKFQYNYNILESILPPSAAGQSTSGWDLSIWDNAIWSAGVKLNFDKVFGGSGIGRYLAVAIRGYALGGTGLSSIDIFWNKGGSL